MLDARFLSIAKLLVDTYFFHAAYYMYIMRRAED